MKSKSLENHLKWLTTTTSSSSSSSRQQRSTTTNSKTFPDAAKYRLNRPTENKRNAENIGRDVKKIMNSTDDNQTYENGKSFLRRNAKKSTGLKPFKPPKPLKRAPKIIIPTKKKQQSKNNSSSGYPTKNTMKTNVLSNEKS